MTMRSEQKERARATLADANTEARQRIVEVVLLAFEWRRNRTDSEVG